jgi:WD40 repeat protein
MRDDRLFQSAALLPSGKVLVTAGKKANIRVLASTELFDPVASTWSVSAPLSFARTGALATRLQSGRVLVSGGDNCTNTGCSEQAVSEIFDEATGQWMQGPALAHGRGLQTQTLLPDGRLLIIGGVDENSALTLTELSE